MGVRIHFQLSQAVKQDSNPTTLSRTKGTLSRSIRVISTLRAVFQGNIGLDDAIKAVEPLVDSALEELVEAQSAIRSPDSSPQTRTRGRDYQETFEAETSIRADEIGIVCLEKVTFRVEPRGDEPQVWFARVQGQSISAHGINRSLAFRNLVWTIRISLTDPTCECSHQLKKLFKPFDP